MKIYNKISSLPEPLPTSPKKRGGMISPLFFKEGLGAYASG